MLTAFKAQAIKELKAGDKSKIESLLAYGDRILVGLSTGTLLIYQATEPSDQQDGTQDVADGVQDIGASKTVGLLRAEEKFSRKPVQQLALVKEVGLLVSLSDAYVSLHDLRDYELIERLERTKGAACFAVTSSVVKDPETHVPGLISRLAVAVKRKILCWTWQEMEQMPDVLEISLEASIKSLNWISGTRLVAGMDPGFTIVDLTSGETTAVNKPAPRMASEVNPVELAGVRFGAVSTSGMGYMGMGSWVPKPMATALSSDAILLAKDVNTLFCDTNGKAMERRQVPWSLAPEAIGYSYPYLLALQAPERGSLQIRNPDTLSLLQTMAVPGANILHVPSPTISLAHAGKGFLVASDRVIWRMNALPYDSQLVELVEKQRFDEAISMLNLLEDTLIDDKIGRIRSMKIQKATALFQQQKYAASIELFIDAETSPDRVIMLFPKSIAGNLSADGGGVTDLQANGSKTHETEIDGTNADMTKPEDGPKEAPSTPSKGMLGILKGGGRRRPDVEGPSVKSPARVEPDTASNRLKGSKTGERPLEGDDLKTAVHWLMSFLAEARKQLQRYLEPDGTLKQDPPTFDKETGRPEFANLLPDSLWGGDVAHTDWQEELHGVARLVDTTLFRAYVWNRPTLVGPLVRQPNFCDAEIVQAALYERQRYNDLIDFLHGKRLHRQALEMLARFGKGEAEGDIPEGMQGPERTVSYLKQIPPDLVDIIFEFVRWPMEQMPEVAMEVFLADSDNAERLPRDRVLEFLASFDLTLEVQYLEHVITELGDHDSDFHQRLVDLYIQALKKDTDDDDERKWVKEKLETFLGDSSLYNKGKTFRQLPADDATFFEARALVLSAMGNHKQALSIYVFQIRDYDKAERYCNKTYLAEQAQSQASPSDGHTIHDRPFKHFEPQDGSENPNIFAILLELYLSAPAGNEKLWPQALDLLSRHGARLPASSTLRLMPDDLAVKELEHYFQGRVRNATSILREEMLVRSLERVRCENAERVVMLGPDHLSGDKPRGRNRRFRIGEEDHCKVCHKRFRAAAVRVYPDNEVIHYGCLGLRGARRGNDGGGGGGGLSSVRRSAGWP